MKWIKILVIAAVSFMAAWFLKPQPKLPEVKTNTVIIAGDSIPYPVKVLIPVPYDSIVYRDNPIPTVVDTEAILHRYFAKYFYRDTIRDSTFVAILNELVTENRIVDRQLEVQNLRPHSVTYTTSIIQPPPKWYVGPVITFGSKPGAGAELLYVKGKNAVGLSGDAVNRSISVKWLYSIH